MTRNRFKSDSVPTRFPLGSRDLVPVPVSEADDGKREPGTSLPRTGLREPSHGNRVVARGTFWRQIAIEVDCRVCSARIGESCRVVRPRTTKQGSLAYIPHRGRYTKALEVRRGG